MDDPRFWFGMPQPEFDFSKVNYRVPTRLEYLQETLPGFDPLAWDIITLWESTPSKRAFKRALKRYHKNSDL